MEYNLRKFDDVTVFDIEGNLVGSNNNILSSELKRLIDNKEVKIVLNMKNVSQLDSYALGILASTGSELQQNGGDMKFCELQPFVSTLFKMMRMDDIFEIYDELDLAVQSFSNKEETE